MTRDADKYQTIEELREALALSEKKKAYYQKIAQDTGVIRLRETEELSILIGRYRDIQQQLKAATDELEQRVRERTGDLLQANALLKQEIRDRKKATKERILLIEQLRQAQKMEAIGALAGGIAHDFNNVLSIIYGNIALSKRKIPKDSPAQQFLDQIAGASDRAKEMIQQILTFGHRHQDKKETLNLAGSIRETFKLLRSSIPSSVDIILNLDESTGTIFADPTQINQVMMNLCVNSCHAMIDDGGTISVSLEDVILNAKSARKHNLKSGRYARIKFKDTGMGIPFALQKRIFEPYFSTKGNTHGTGRGLAMAHGIVKKHGGAIFVNSVPGEGCEFTILLPIVEGIESHYPKETISHAPKGTEKILFVDDEKVLVEAMTQLLENLGYTVVAQTNSLEALRVFTESPKEFDLIITDQTMPNLTGVNLAREIRKVRSDIPIVLCTGYTTVVNAGNYEEFGLNAFLSKPMEEYEIANAIRHSLESQGN